MKIKDRWVGFSSMHVRESSGFRVQVLKKNEEMDGKLIETSFLCRF
jgi:hypothetical protein